MKIAIVTPGFLPVPAVFGGAIEVLIQEIIDGNEKGKKLLIDLFTIPNDKLNEFSYEKTRIIQVRTNKIDKIQSVIYNRVHMLISKVNKNEKGNYISPYSVRIKKMINKDSYDYIIVENNLTVINTMKRKSNLIFHLHNDILGDDKPLYQCKKMLEICNKVITISDFMKRRLLSVNGSSNVKVLFNCINFDVFKKELNIKKTGINFFYSGRIVEEKGVLELLKAFSLICSEYSNVSLTIVGKSVFGNNLGLSSYEEKIKAESEKNKDKVNFTGFVEHNDIPNYLAKCDCVVIPTICEESFGVVALEAMAMEKAIISTISGGLPEVADNNCTIFINRDNLVENLYLAMKKIIENSGLCKTLGENGYKRVHSIKDFDKNNYFQNFYDCITK